MADKFRYRVTLKAPGVSDWVIKRRDGSELAGDATAAEILGDLQREALLGISPADVQHVQDWLEAQKAALGAGLLASLTIAEQRQLEVVVEPPAPDSE